MSTHPVTPTEIADLLAALRSISHPNTADPATRAAILARKADLLRRISQADTPTVADQPAPLGD